MIKRAPASKRAVKVTFVLPIDDVDQPASVVGDFNDWDPLAHPMKKRSNGTRSVSIELATGSSYRFKYLTADGNWHCDPDAETVVHDEYGHLDSVISC